MINKLLLLMMLGHVLGDFYFQTDKITSDKDEKIKGVIVHAVEYFVSVLVVTLPVINFEMFIMALCMSVVHFVIEIIKYILLKKKKIKKSGRLFVGNQILHLISIFILSYILYCQNIQMAHFRIIREIGMAFGINFEMIAKWMLAILVLHTPSNILIQSLLSGYKPKKDNGNLIEVDNKVGRKIGTIERLIMLMFISMDQYAAMGLVLTAKSIARYDKIAKNEKFAEYYLLGTLLSTACVVACKMVILK